jgi:hypothetical protein
VVDAEEAAALRQQTGLDIAEGTRHSADSHAARHVAAQHGDQATEAARGQSPLTADDFRLVQARKRV